MYEVVLKPKAEKELDKLDKDLICKIVRQMIELQNDPYPSDSKKLQDTDIYKIRIDDFRELYEIDTSNEIIKISRIRNRKDAYK